MNAKQLVASDAYDAYWRFAAERQAVYYRRLAGTDEPWTSDPIIRSYRFTNAYRAADRVSQYLIREVQYGCAHTSNEVDLFFRTVLFKLFNRIETWEAIEYALGPITARTPLHKISNVLDSLMNRGSKIYSAAYIMPPPPYGKLRKHANHLAMLGRMLDDGLTTTLVRARSLQSVFETLMQYPGLGQFLAFQLAIDLNYSDLLSFEETDFVVAGPGALDGISKCFINTGSATPSEIIYMMFERQDTEFKRRGLEFRGLFGRRLQPVDCQNLFCEVSKYTRVSHPSIMGVSGRTRIKQLFKENLQELSAPFFPPKWGLNINSSIAHKRFNQSSLPL